MLRTCGPSFPGLCNGLGADRMTEDQIERRVERMTDSLDRRYLTSSMTADEYAAEARRIDAWARDALAKRGG